MSHIAGVKKDMIILEKSEFSALRSENEVQITVLDSATLELAFLNIFFLIYNDIEKHLVPKEMTGAGMVWHLHE